MTQIEKIEKFMEEHGEITQRDAIWLGVYRLASRIHEMRKAGANIKVESRKVNNADGSESWVAVYSLGEGDEK